MVYTFLCECVYINSENKKIYFTQNIVIQEEQRGMNEWKKKLFNYDCNDSSWFLLTVNKKCNKKIKVF